MHCCVTALLLKAEAIDRLPQVIGGTVEVHNYRNGNSERAHMMLWLPAGEHQPVYHGLC